MRILCDRCRKRHSRCKQTLEHIIALHGCPQYIEDEVIKE